MKHCLVILVRMINIKTYVVSRCIQPNLLRYQLLYIYANVASGVYIMILRHPPHSVSYIFDHSHKVIGAKRENSLKAPSPKQK
jgi:hypothetical protein